MNAIEDNLYILFGSRTGNSKAVAVLAHEYAESLGYTSVLQNMQEMDYQEIEHVNYLLVIVSTHGEGEPPVQAEAFYDFINSDDLIKVKAKYAVLGLGDSSYRYFCQTGEDIDNRLSILGGQRLMEFERCDIDFQEPAKEWILDVFKRIKSLLPVKNKPLKDGFTFELKLDDGSHSAYRAELLEKRLLTKGNSSKKVLHVSLSLKNSGIEYQPGDAIGIYSTNSRSLVDELLATLGFDKTYPVKVKNDTRMLKELLIHEYELTLLTPVVISKYAAVVNNPALDALVEDESLLVKYKAESDILDLVTDYRGDISVDQLLDILRPLNLRLYSAASSRSAVGESVDVTIKIIENKRESRTRYGVCSSFLWNRLDVGDRVPVTLEKIPKFRLPDDDQAMIMVSAGSGIAPFRAFLQERSARKAKGKNWLIFGERNRGSDFLYEDELVSYKSTGLLNKLCTAFSRDQKEKYYVSHLIEKEFEAIMAWIENGAVFYVCGNKDKLGISVRQSMVNIISKYFNMNKRQSLAYLNKLKENRQYQEEVY